MMLMQVISVYILQEARVSWSLIPERKKSCGEKDSNCAVPVMEASPSVHHNGFASF